MQPPVKSPPGHLEATAHPAFRRLSADIAALREARERQDLVNEATALVSRRAELTAEVDQCQGRIAEREAALSRLRSHLGSLEAELEGISLQLMSTQSRAAGLPPLEGRQLVFFSQDDPAVRELTSFLDRVQSYPEIEPAASPEIEPAPSPEIEPAPSPEEPFPTVEDNEPPQPALPASGEVGSPIAEALAKRPPPGMTVLRSLDIFRAIERIALLYNDPEHFGLSADFFSRRLDPNLIASALSGFWDVSVPRDGRGGTAAYPARKRLRVLPRAAQTSLGEGSPGKPGETARAWIDLFVSWMPYLPRNPDWGEVLVFDAHAMSRAVESFRDGLSRISTSPPGSYHQQIRWWVDQGTLVRIGREDLAEVWRNTRTPADPFLFQAALRSHTRFCFLLDLSFPGALPLEHIAWRMPTQGAILHAFVGARALEQCRPRHSGPPSPTNKDPRPSTFHPLPVPAPRSWVLPCGDENTHNNHLDAWEGTE